MLTSSGLNKAFDAAGYSGICRNEGLPYYMYIFVVNFEYQIAPMYYVDDQFYMITEYLPPRTSTYRIFK